MAAPEAPIPVRIEFDAPPGCSSADAFYAGVRARTDRVRRAQPVERALILRVRLTRAGASAHGELGGFDESSKTETRLVDGASCDEVVEALSLTAALAIDPNARFTREPSALDAARPVEPSPSAPANGRERSPAEREAERSRSLDEEELERESRVHERELEHRAEPFEITFGVTAIATRVVTGESSFGGGVSARFAQRGPGVVQPSFGLTFLHARNDVLGESENVAVRFTSFALSACPLRIAHGDLALTPCGLGLAGWLNAEGKNVSQTDSVLRSWWSLGALVRGSAALGSDLGVELELGVTVPLVRRRFVTEIPEEFVGATPDVAPLAGLGLTYTF